MWMFKTCLIQYFIQPFFRNYALVLAPRIKFSHLFVVFTCSFPLYFSEAFRHKDPLGRMLFALIHFIFLAYYYNSPYLCFSFIGT
jgi:hypothetical protein